MSQTVIGIFDNASEAQDAVEQLVKKGFDRSAIDISTTGSGTGTSGSAYSTGSDTASFNLGTSPSPFDTGSSSMGAGSSTYDTNPATNYGTGSSGYGTGSASSDNKEGESKIGKFFKSLFGGDDDTDDRYSKYSNAAEQRSVVTVHAQSADQAEDAADILDDYGAIDIDDNSTSSNTSKTASTGTTLQAGQSTGEATSIPIIEEQLQVGKRTVETGGVRLRSRIVERPVEESLRLREERVYVDRTPVNRPVSGTELENFREGTIELTESAEVPVVAKEAYVKEEVRLGKDVSEREETIRDTVRSTEVDVENLKTDTNITDSSKSSYGSSNTSSDLTSNS